MRFADVHVRALWQAMIVFRQPAEGFGAADLRRHHAAPARDLEATPSSINCVVCACTT
jgi:hypothetical protein